MFAGVIYSRSGLWEGSVRGIAVFSLIILLPLAARGALVTNVGVLAGDQNSVANDINNAGLVVGSSYGTVATDPNQANYFHAFSFSAVGGINRLGVLTTYPNPQNRANAVNQAGVIIGTQSQAFVYRGAGPMQTLP